MPDLIPGEIKAIANVPDTDGTWRTAVIIHTKTGEPTVGVLVAPPNGGAGVIGFEPVPRLAEGMAGSPELAQALTPPVRPRRPGMVS